MITYQSRWLKYVELRFDESCPASDFDVMYRFRANAPVPDAANEPFHTLVVDLTKSEQDIFLGFNRNTRSKIKRAAAEDGLSYEVMSKPSLETVGEFIDYYKEFARTKDIASLERAHIDSQRASGALVLSRIANAERTLIWHAYLHFKSHALLCHSASLYRGRDKELKDLVGRANRLHHFKDMLFFKASACNLYDFGGWYPGTEDKGRLMINRFKEGFGGQKVLQYNAVLIRTWRAKLLKAIRRLA